MLYVKVVTPLVLKRWVWPTIKCSHLTPKSIYSYIDDLVIANYLIGARVFVHALPHISFAILLCEHVGCIIFSIWVHPFVAIWLFGLSFYQMDGKECLSTPSSYPCFFSSQRLFMPHHKILNKSFSDPPGEKHSEPPIHQGLPSHNFLVNFGQTNSLLLGPTKTTRLI